MHKVKAKLLLTLVLASSAVSISFESLFSPLQRSIDFTPSCMADDDAQNVANGFQALIAQYSNIDADGLLTTDFSDFSDSVNTLIDAGCTHDQQVLGEATFSSRAGFEQGQSGQPPIPFEQVNLWHNCNTVFLRWRSVQRPRPVTGIVVLDCLQGEQGWQVERVYSEFNSGAWLSNLGATTSRCAAGR